MARQLGGAPERLSALPSWCTEVRGMCAMPRRSSITARPAPAHGVAAVLPCLAATCIRLFADHPPAAGPAPHPQSHPHELQAPHELRALGRRAPCRPPCRRAACRAPCPPPRQTLCRTLCALQLVPALPAFGHPVVLLVLICGVLLLAAAVAYLGFRLTRRMVLSPSAPPAEPKEAEPKEGEPEEGGEMEAAGSQRPAPPPGEVDGLAPGVNRTLGQLEEALERQRRFSSDASHELRTPMTAMRTQIEDALQAPQETDVVTLARALLPSLDRLQRIATDLLALSQLESDALPIRRQRVDLGKLAEGELQMLPITKRMVPLLGPDVVVLGDPHSLGSLISNLIRNAQRHAASTVTVTVRREPREPREPGGSPDGSSGGSSGGSPGGSPGGTAVLEVTDDGPGIPREQREKVFQRFTRLDSARSRDAGGAGLGLAIARQVAQNHGGRLTIEDSAEGARFVLRLPLAQ
ncbi:HAMP domain-containing histidine kinase [Microbispora hainanensis]|uniref:histidine kinase n=1 Tax=Microbispora hainanensis TaxID=568844 RepID=A0A544YVQ4_9ACTN|nr:HAMP domain-containing histidine kinase [Microbispora hainanensis]